MKDIASLFGAENVFILSVDDKAKVPIGVTAANKQSPLIMHVDNEIRLPYHDFAKATRHKLTPSVYFACEIRTASSKITRVHLTLLFALVNTTPVQTTRMTMTLILY